VGKTLTSGSFSLEVERMLSQARNIWFAVLPLKADFMVHAQTFHECNYVVIIL
jgi:hypothetical protein